MPELKRVVSEYSGIVFSLPWLVARDEGLFRDEGIDIVLVRARGAANRDAQVPTPPTEAHHNPEEVNPILGHGLFEEAECQLYRA